MEASPNKRNKLLIIASGIFILIGVVFFLYWMFVLRFEVYTDDAYVNGNMVEITPQVSGVVSAIYVDNTDYVEANQVIIELDKTDYRIALEKSIHNLGETVRKVAQLFIQVEEQEAELEMKRAHVLKAEQDYQNRVDLVSNGGVSKENFEHVETALLSARASYQESLHSLEASVALIQNSTVRTHPLVMEASEQLKESYVNLKRCDILSPVSGYVAKRAAQLGESVNPNGPLLAIIPLDDLWIDANFKETKLSKMRIGQKVRMVSDIYGREMIYHGRVVGINPGTGSVFSVLPPQNATGNWIKIVQRVPVRISLNKEELERVPLWLGLSMNVKVSTKETYGKRLAEAKPVEPLYQTNIYSEQEKGARDLIETVIQENLNR